MIQWPPPANNERTHAATAVPAGVLIAGACLALAGCQNPGGNAQQGSWADLLKPQPTLTVTTAPADSDPALDSSGTRRRASTVLQLSFDVLRTQVPQGTFSESGKIWNHLDEQILPTEVATVLQRNGLRIARGKVTSWAPIKALLDAEKDVTSIQNAMSVGNGLPLDIELDSQPHDQTLFLFRRDGSWPGATLPGSMNLLHIEYVIPAATPDSVLLEVMPEIRFQPPEPAITPEGWRERPVVPPSRMFRELAARVQIGPEEFLAVGPSLAAHRAHTIGSLMLGHEIEGRRYECMFFITPRVVRKGLPGGRKPASGAPAAARAPR